MFPEGRILEFMLAAIVALIVVGPKDLPVLLRKLGQFMAKVRAMAAEFRASFDEMARQSELDELRKEVDAMRKGQFADMAGLTPEATQTFNEISQGLSDVGVELNQPVSYQYAAAETAVEAQPLPKARARKAPAKTGAAKAPSGPKPPANKTAPVNKAAAKTSPAPKVVAKSKSAAKPPAKAAPAAAATAKPAVKARRTAKTGA